MKAKPTNKQLQNYLTVALGSGLAATQADAAVSLTFYEPGATSTNATVTSGAAFTGGEISLQSTTSDGKDYVMFSCTNPGSGEVLNFGIRNGGFSDGSTDFEPGSMTPDLTFLRSPNSGEPVDWFNGAAAGINYARVTFDASPDGGETVFDTVFMFDLDISGAPQGTILGFARDEGQDLAITDAVAAGLVPQSASAVPEPASNLALLALGASGLLLRRRQQRAA